MLHDNYSTTKFTIPFSGFAVSSTGGASFFDLWSVLASSLSRLEIHEINIGQLSSAVSANQQLSVQVFSGSTALGGGAAVTPRNTKRWSAAPAALCTANAPSSSLASTASAALIYADATDVSGNWLFQPKDVQDFVIDAGQALNVRVSAPPVSTQLSGTLTIRETGKP